MGYPASLFLLPGLSSSPGTLTAPECYITVTPIRLSDPEHAARGWALVVAIQAPSTDRS